MSIIEPLEAIIQKYKSKKQPNNKKTLQYLKILNQMFESKANDFYEFMQGIRQQSGLLISNIKFKNHCILTTNFKGNPIVGIIKKDFQGILDSEFLLGFTQEVDKKIGILRKKEGEKQYRGRLLTFCKDQQEKNINGKNYTAFHKPLLLRIDYQIINQKINYPSLAEGINEIVFIAYTLSSIKKEVFTQNQIKYYINDGYRLLQKSKTQSLINKVIKSKWFNIYKNISIYKNLDKNKLVYNGKASENTLPSLKKISLALIYTKWESGYTTFATGFLFDHRAVLTSAKNIIQGKNFVISDLEVCLNPHQNEREWISIDRKSIKKLQCSETVLLILPQLKNKLKKRVAIKIQDHSNRLPSYVYSCHVYGFQFRMEGQNLVFSSTLSTSIFEQQPSFDSFYNIKSNSSAGGLVFFIHNNEPTLFGIYNPFNKSVFNFDLIHGSFSQNIYAIIQNKQVVQQSQNVFSGEATQTVKFTQLQDKPYSAIGMVYSKLQEYDSKYKNRTLLDRKNAQGTGTFITPNIILTCAHNVLKQQKGRTLIASEVQFYPGLSKRKNQKRLSDVVNGDYPRYIIPKEDIYVPQAYLSNYSTNNESRYTSDIAILYVRDKCHPSYLNIKSVEENDKHFWESTKLKICGYPGESEGTMKQTQGYAIVDTSFVQQKNEDFKRFPNTIYYEIYATQGNSGTGIIVKNEKNQFEVVAIHTLGYFSKKQGKKVDLINSGILLVDQNLKFVKEKLEILSEPNKILQSQFCKFYKQKFD